MRDLKGLLLTTLCTILFSTGYTQPGHLQFFVRDQVTGEALPGTIEVYQRDGAKLEETDLPKNGHLTLDLSPGQYNFRFSAPNYNSLQTHFVVDTGQSLPVQIHLDPRQLPSTYQDFLSAPRDSGTTTFQGKVIDQQSGQPLSNASISIPSYSKKVQTNQEGYFSIQIPASSTPPQPRTEPDKVSLNINKNGFKQQIKKGFDRLPTKYWLKITLQRGQTPDTTRSIHGIYHADTFQLSPSPQQQQRSGATRQQGPSSVIAPPASIRVGDSCSCNTCSNVLVMSLESYVQSGITDEWISTWKDHSLRAGAIPYRTYGAYHVNNPIDPNYDICGTPCCQAWDSDQQSSGANAAIYTSGIMLHDGGNIAYSEYSAENNDAGCGDCYSGTGSGWPCISDTLCCGESTFGHGRGMCQWGSQRWANQQGKTWKWINQHYYNPGNYSLSSPLEITGGIFRPNPAAPGLAGTIKLTIENYAEDPHDQIMLGATILGVGSDPPNDKKVTLQPGTNTKTRLFRIPPGTPDSTYDLLVALWFDVDENDTINGADRPLHTYTLNNAVTVEGIPPTTSIDPFSKWHCCDFNVSFTDNDNDTLRQQYHQLIHFNGRTWTANHRNGFFSDNFDSIIHPVWTSHSGDWKIKNDRLMQTNDSLFNSNLSAPLNQNVSNQYLYHWQMKITGSGSVRRAGIHLFCDTPSQSNRGNSYLVWIEGDNNELRIYKSTNNTLRLEQTVPMPINIGQWYDYKVTYDKTTGQFFCYQDDTPVVAWRDSTPITNGQSVSFRTGDSKTYFDNLKVYHSRSSSITAQVGSDTTQDLRYENPDRPTFAGKVKTIVQDRAGNLSPIRQRPIYIDWTPPEPVNQIRDGTGGEDIDTTNQDNQLSANWTSTVDNLSGLRNYWYAIGTQPGDSNVVAWKSHQWDTSFTESLSLTQGQTYYTSIYSRDTAGNTTALTTSDGVLYTTDTVTDTTGLNPAPLPSSLRIVPNPTSGQFDVQIRLASPQPVSLTILNGLGQVVEQEQFEAVQEANYPVSLRQPPGIYFVRLQVGRHSLSRKVSVVK